MFREIQNDSKRFEEVLGKIPNAEIFIIQKKIRKNPMPNPLIQPQHIKSNYKTDKSHV